MGYRRGDLTGRNRVIRPRSAGSGSKGSRRRSAPQWPEPRDGAPRSGRFAPCAHPTAPVLNTWELPVGGSRQADPSCSTPPGPGGHPQDPRPAHQQVAGCDRVCDHQSQPRPGQPRPAGRPAAQPLGRSRRYTTSAMSPSPRTPARSAPAAARTSWRPCATWSSACCAGRGRSTSPPRYATTPATLAQAPRPLGIDFGCNRHHHRTTEPCTQLPGCPGGPPGAIRRWRRACLWHARRRDTAVPRAPHATDSDGR
jgi:hypothetical protein